MNRDGDSEASVELLWIPVGAGGHVVGHASRWWELIQARLAHRSPQRLFHAALEIFVDDASFVIEMAPAWGGGSVDRGVVCDGPVGLHLLGRSRLFRYEVRCWRDGMIPDRQWAVGAPTVVTHSTSTARAVLNQIRAVPSLTWGRNVDPTGDMWNSNSLISWLLATCGIGATDVHPPLRGRAPGWDAGLTIAQDPHLALAN